MVLIKDPFLSTRGLMDQTPAKCSPHSAAALGGALSHPRRARPRLQAIPQPLRVSCTLSSALTPISTRSGAPNALCSPPPAFPGLWLGGYTSPAPALPASPALPRPSPVWEKMAGTTRMVPEALPPASPPWSRAPPCPCGACSRAVSEPCGVRRGPESMGILPVNL